MSAATVRAQLSRAHEMLRQKLDAEFGGDRKAWSVALAAWSFGSSTRIAGAKIALAAVAVGVIGTAVVAWIWIGRGTSAGDEIVGVAPNLAKPNAGASSSVRSDERAGDILAALASDPTERSSIAPPSREVAIPVTSELEDMAKEGRQIQLILRQRLLAPDPALEPQVTITKRGEDKVEEYRVNGKLYMIKVTPPHGVPYYLMDVTGDGSMVRRDSLDTGLRVPQWVIHSF